MAITVVTPPSETKLAELSTVKLLLGITDTDSDTLLNTLIDSVTKAAETFTGREFGLQTVDETLCGNNKYNLRVTGMPLVSITSVTVDDVAVDSDDYSIVDAKSGQINNVNTWKCCSKGLPNVKIRYQYGYDLSTSIPADISMAVARAVSNLYSTKFRDMSEKSREVPDVYKVVYHSAKDGISGTGFMTTELAEALGPYRSVKV